MKRYKVVLEATIDVLDYAREDGVREQTPADIERNLLKTASPANGYAIADLGTLTATLHIDKVTFITKDCPHCGAGTPMAEKIP